MFSETVSSMFRSFRIKAEMDPYCSVPRPTQDQRRNSDVCGLATHLAGFSLGQQIVPEQRGPGLVGGQLPLQVAAVALARARRLHRHHARALRHAPRRHVQVDYTLRTRRRDTPIRLLNPVCQTGIRERSPYIKKECEIVMAHTLETKFTHRSLDSVLSSEGALPRFGFLIPKYNS